MFPLPQLPNVLILPENDWFYLISFEFLVWFCQRIKVEDCQWLMRRCAQQDTLCVH